KQRIAQQQVVVRGHFVRRGRLVRVGRKPHDEARGLQQARQGRQRPDQPFGVGRLLQERRVRLELEFQQPEQRERRLEREQGHELLEPVELQLLQPLELRRRELQLEEQISFVRSW